MLLTGLFIGLVGGMHCVLMCSPVVFALNPSRKFGRQFAYHAGRIFMYAMLGLLIGAIGGGLSFFGWQQGLSIAMGVLMILMTLIPSMRTRLYSLSSNSPFLRSARQWMQGAGSLKPVVAGMLNGLLPCGLVYVGLTGSLALGNMLDGSLFMLGFGLGTVPWLAGVVSASAFIPVAFRKKASRAVPILAIFIGVLFILRGLALDIPYLSPALQAIGLPEQMTICGG